MRGRLIDARTKNIQSSADIMIERKELNPDDLTLIDNMADEFKSAQKKKSYQEHLEKLVAANLIILLLMSRFGQTRGNTRLMKK